MFAGFRHRSDCRIRINIADKCKTNNNKSTNHKNNKKQGKNNKIDNNNKTTI